MYRVIDLQQYKYFWDGHKFKSKREIIEALADFHNIDFDEGDFIEWLDKHLKTDDDKLKYLLDYGERDVEELKLYNFDVKMMIGVWEKDTQSAYDELQNLELPYGYVEGTFELNNVWEGNKNVFNDISF